MSYKVVVSNYGKITRAEVEVTPLTLFVGDNNSGKSYMMSLIWALTSGTQNEVIFAGLNNIIQKRYKTIYDRILGLIETIVKGESTEERFEESEFVDIINELLDRNKTALVNGIFNSNNVKIESLNIALTDCSDIIISYIPEEKGEIRITFKKDQKPRKHIWIFQSASMLSHESIPLEFIRTLCEQILQQVSYPDSTVYLPAARTGFMLARNSINKAGRSKAYDFQFKFELDDEGKIINQGIDSGNNTLEPFPKPIIHFLDVMENLPAYQNSRYPKLLDWIKSHMSRGELLYNKGTTNDVQYIPEGLEKAIPLRAASAVITELTPLILLLKHSNFLYRICYEEPEMCLHPQLQLQMAKLLIRLVNNNINLVVTTHSDIIIQHINNMCLVNGMTDNQELKDRLDLNASDLIDIKKVSVYQFTDQGTGSVVERIEALDGEFKIPSFTDALKDILNQTSEIYEYISELED